MPSPRGDAANKPSAEPDTYPADSEPNANPIQTVGHSDSHQPDSGPERAERDKTSSSPSRSSSDVERKETEEAARREKEAIAELEARLPRPDWYSSDDEDSVQSSAEESIEVSDLKKRAEGSVAGLVVFTLLMFVSFVFNLTSSCPIPWMRGKGDRKGRQYGIWRAKKGGLPDLKVNNIHDCSEEMQYWQAAAAFSVMATFTSFGGMIGGILQCTGHGHLGANLALSMYSMVFSLTSWALVARLFGYNCCGRYKYKDFARLDAGFALTLIAFALQLAAVILLGVHFMTYYTKSVHAGVTRPMRFVYLALLIVVAVFYTVGPAYTQWEKNFPLIKCKVTMWRIEVYDKHAKISTMLGRKYYRCSTFTRRMKVVAAFNIMANIWLALGILTATGACYIPKMRPPANLLGFLACLFQLVAWLVLVITRHGHLCTTPVPNGVSLWHDMGYNGVPNNYENGQIRFDGYAMKEGFALMMTGWAVNLVSCVISCIIA